MGHKARLKTPIRQCALPVSWQARNARLDARMKNRARRVVVLARDRSLMSDVLGEIHLSIAPLVTLQFWQPEIQPRLR
jgi:hypothetical protein